MSETQQLGCAPASIRHAPAAPFRAGELVGGRYRLRGLLGRGGQSEVWEADDEISGDVIALKLMHPPTNSEPARVRREILALRLLRVPGVVRLLDEGLHGDRPFLVIERVDGAPFPGEGRRGSWPAIAEVTIALVETLARIHAAGVIHRDLTPANVLVNAEGRPIVLDFGISSGSRLGEGITQTGCVVGTLEYLAPEQLLYGTVTEKTDVYALGLLLYKALSGVLPHASADRQKFMRARSSERALPLHLQAPGLALPREVAGLIDLLLASEPERRPSAAEVLHILRGQPLAHLSGPALPRLDGDAPVAALLEALKSRRAVDLVGQSQCGRSRCLQDVREALLCHGLRVARTTPGSRPFASLEPVIGPIEDRASSRLAQILEAVDERLRDALAGGIVLLVDDADRLDRWSAAAIDRCRSAGAVARVVPASACPRAEGASTIVRLEPIEEAALRSLFAGPERLLHLRTDAARALWVRTEGRQGRVAEEITAWLRAGVVRWDESALAIDRDTLDRLEAGLRVVPLPRSAPFDAASGAALPSHLEDLAAWISTAWPITRPEQLASVMGLPVWRVEADADDLVLRGAARWLQDGRVEPAIQADQAWSPERRRLAHRAIAQALPPGDEGRLRHLIAGTGELGAADMDALEVAREATVLARQLATDGRLGHAVAALGEGLLVLRRCAAPLGEERVAVEEKLLSLWVEVALAERRVQAHDRVLYELSRAEPRTRATEHLEALVRAAIAYGAGGDRAITLLDDMAPFDDLDLERHRQGLRVLAARRCSPQREQAVLAEVARWASRSGDPTTRARLAGWMGRLRYREGRFREAARYQKKAADTDPWATERIAARINGASALLEAFCLREAAAWAADALEKARSCRHSFYELRAEWILRSAAYRSGEATQPDLALVEAVAQLDAGDTEAAVYLNEASVAHRAGEQACALDLASRALRIWTSLDNTAPALLARCLALAAGARAEGPAEIDALFHRARECDGRGLGLQALGLLARAQGGAVAAWKDVALRRAGEIPRKVWRLRMDILSVAEALEALGLGPGSASQRRRR